MANKNSHTIERICCVCRKLQPVAQMTRVVRVDDKFLVQGQQRLNGRGAHVCAFCVGGPHVLKCLSRSFKTAVPKEILQQISQANAK